MLYINDNITETGLVSIKERGLRFGDGVFTTIKIHEGKIFFLQEHLARLCKDLMEIKIHYPAAEFIQIENKIRNLININKVIDGVVRIIISRGVGKGGYSINKTTEPLLIIEAENMVQANASEAISLWLSTITRASINSLPMNSKLTHGISSTMALIEASEQSKSYRHALMLNDQGFIAEEASSNIFWLANDRTLYTPSLDCSALAGVTRGKVIDIAKKSGYRVVEGRFAIDTLDHDKTLEVFLTNSLAIVLPVKRVMPLGFYYDSYDFALKIKELVIEAATR